MKHKNRVIAATVFIGVFSAVGVVFGAAMTQEDRLELREDRKEVRDEIKEEHKEVRDGIKENRKENREQVKARKCEGVESRIRTRVGRYENKKEQHKRVFDKIVSRIETLVEKFEESDLNVSQLKTDLETFKGMVADLHEEHDSLIKGLKETQEQACGESEGEYRKQLGEARRMVPEVRAELTNVRDYYKTVIRVDILDLRKQVADVSDDDEQDEVDDSDQDDSQQ